MNQQELLKEKAIAFEQMLNKYALQDDEVKEFLEKMKPWFKKIARNEVTSPFYGFPYKYVFSNPDMSRLAIKYAYSQPNHELGNSAASFTVALQGLL